MVKGQDPQLQIILHGCGGRMGQAIQDIVKDDPEIKIVAGIDPRELSGTPFSVYRNVEDCNVPGDVVVDFSTASAIPALLDYVSAKKLPAVICTTGLGEDLNKKIDECAQHTSIFRSPNMTFGIHVMAYLLKQAARVLSASGFDIEVIESHHRYKIDAPSGTALFLADTVNEALDNKLKYALDRTHGGKREPNELGMHSIRGGTIVGEHTVLFAGRNETLALTHTAQSRDVFAVGAVQAAKFMKGKKKGIFEMADMIDAIMKV